MTGYICGFLPLSFAVTKTFSFFTYDVVIMGRKKKGEQL